MQSDIEELKNILSAPVNILILLCSLIFVISLSSLPFYSYSIPYWVSFKEWAGSSIYVACVMAAMTLLVASLLGERSSSVLVFSVIFALLLWGHVNFLEARIVVSDGEIVSRPLPDIGFFSVTLSCLFLIFCNLFCLASENRQR